MILLGISSVELNAEYDYSEITDMAFMFYGCHSLVKFPNIDTSNIITMKRMFSGCSELKYVPDLNTENVSDFEAIFWGCPSLERVNIENFKGYDFMKHNSDFMKKIYPEYCI